MTVKLQTPPRIKKGDTAFIISPSAGLIPFIKNRADRAFSHLSEMGLNVVYAANSKKNSGYVSSTPQERVDDIHQAFSNPHCTLIMASIGGNHSNQLLSLLDYDLISQNPKVFIGYSDVTVLHYALATQARLQTYYGPCFLTQFGEYPAVQPYTKESFEKMLFEDDHEVAVECSSTYTDEILDWFKNDDGQRARKLTKNKGYEWWRSGSASGWAFPVTVPSVNHLLGTKYMPIAKGAVLFLDIPEGASMHEGLALSELDAWLADLKNVGILSEINGLIIGRPYKYSKEMVEGLKNIVLGVTAGTNYPILFNANIGHTDPIITLPIGSKILLDSKNDESYFRIKY